MSDLFKLPPAPDAEETVEAVETAPTELDMLKSRARLIGVQFSNNISIETLRARIAAKLKEEDEAPAAEPAAEEKDESVVEKSSAKLSMRDKIIKEGMKLVRLRITNLDPKKKDLPGEIFTVANRYLGTVRKYIPYGEATDNGYHVPHCIYEQMKERTFLSIRTRKDPRGRIIVETQDVREFALEKLEPLTKEDLARLAAAQAAASSD